MWVEELKNGKFKFVERYTDELTGHTRKVSLTASKNTKKIREDMLIRLRQKINNKQFSTNNITFSKLLDLYLASKEKQIKKSTFSVQKYRINKLKKELGNIQISKLTPTILNHFIHNMIDTHSKETVRSYFSTIKLVLKYGYRLGYINDTRLLERLYLPPMKTVDTEWKYLEKGEYTQVINCIYDMNKPEIARLCQIQCETGMRYGELVAIDYRKHIDFINKTLLIERTHDYKSQTFATPKNGKSRMINLSERTIELIKEQINFDREKILLYDLSKTNTLLFRSQYDNPISVQSTNNVLRKIEIEGKKITTHIFRHTFITRLLESGVETKLIAIHVGHTDERMINKVYGHFSDKMNDTLKSAIQSIDFN